MRTRSMFPILFWLLLLAGCRESRSPADPSGSQPAFPSSYSLFGQVLSSDRAPVAEARIDVQDDRSVAKSTLSDNEGKFRITGLTQGRYTIVASREGFLEAVTVVVIGGILAEIRHDFVLARNTGGLIPAYELSGMTWVKGSEGRSAYVGARVEVVDGPQAGLNEESDEMGIYSLRGLVAGTIQVRASKDGRSETKTVELSGARLSVYVDFSF